MFRILVKATAIVVTRAIAVIVGLAASVYFQLVGDLRAPVSAQINEALGRLHDLARVLDALR